MAAHIQQPHRQQLSRVSPWLVPHSPDALKLYCSKTLVCSVSRFVKLRYKSCYFHAAGVLANPNTRGQADWAPVNCCDRPSMDHVDNPTYARLPMELCPNCMTMPYLAIMGLLGLTNKWDRWPLFLAALESTLQRKSSSTHTRNTAPTARRILPSLGSCPLFLFLS